MNSTYRRLRLWRSLNVSLRMQDISLALSNLENNHMTRFSVENVFIQTGKQFQIADNILLSMEPWAAAKKALS